jgi:Family of unknown function (DUF6527)
MSHGAVTESLVFSMVNSSQNDPDALTMAGPRVDKTGLEVWEGLCASRCDPSAVYLRAMGQKIREQMTSAGVRRQFCCQGCSDVHAVTEAWAWNGSFERPTFTPSVLVRGVGPDGRPTVCHTYITNGQVTFLPDCSHALAGKTVDLPDWPAPDAAA